MQNDRLARRSLTHTHSRRYVRYISGQSVGATLETVSAMTTGVVISCLASWEIFLVMIAMVPLLGVTEVFQWMAIKGSSGIIKKEMEKSQALLGETVNGIREVQAFALEKNVSGDINKSIEDTVAVASLKAAISKGVMMGMIQLIQFTVYAFAFWIGGQLIVAGKIEFANFNEALWAMAFAASGLGQAAMFAGDAAKASNAVKSIFTTLDRIPEIDSKPWDNNGLADGASGEPTERAISTSPPGAVSEEKHKGEFDLEQVNFAYPTRRAAKVFDSLTLKIPAGKSVALVGSSGSGKSTVVQLLERFYDPIVYKAGQGEGEAGVYEMEIVVDGETGGAGEIKMDGEATKLLDPRWMRENMGLVGQEPVLFNDSIFNNIALGVRGGASKEAVVEAAKLANAHDFIMKLDEGYETNVGSAGGKVSGGQKQRIAIARALISQPKVLLLDEATSALDNESEKVVQAALDELVKSGGRTTVIIAHRLSTIRNCDVILVLDNNGDGSKVVEQGTHEELLKLGGKYKKLVEAYERD